MGHPAQSKALPTFYGIFEESVKSRKDVLADKLVQVEKLGSRDVNSFEFVSEIDLDLDPCF
jgi:hypothetical protein